MVALAARMQLVLQPHALQGVNGTGVCCVHALARGACTCAAARMHTLALLPLRAAGPLAWHTVSSFVCLFCMLYSRAYGGRGRGEQRNPVM